MAYQRKNVVPNVRLSDGGLRMFEGLSPDEKETVFGYFMEHWDAARVKTVSPDAIPDLPKLERRLANCLEALCQSADEGISEYWRMVARNHRNAPRIEEPMDNDTLTTGKPIIHLSNKQSNEPINNSSIHPSITEIETYCQEKGLISVDVQGFMETMERQGWRSKDGRVVEDWKSLIRAWGREKPGKTVSAQQYTQRNYQPGELDEVGDDLLEEARQQKTKYSYLFEGDGITS